MTDSDDYLSAVAKWRANGGVRHEPKPVTDPAALARVQAISRRRGWVPPAPAPTPSVKLVWNKDRR